MSSTSLRRTGRTHPSGGSSEEINPERPLLTVGDVKLGYPMNGQLNIAVDNVSFDVWSGEKIMLLGPSGCGKSTLLKCVAGFLSPVAGEIAMQGRERMEPGPDRAVVFQEFDQLFPWFTVRGNIAYPQVENGRDKREAARRTDQYLELMNLQHAADRYPYQLSGGMKQRVAIARALALDPAILLMDEPFGALDAQTRSRLQAEMHAVTKQTGVTVVFVTHSIQEAVYLGDRVVVLGQPPSRVVEIMDVQGIEDPDDAAFTEALHHLRSLLGHDDTKIAFE
ncbi:ABC transporter ATP-binding protein [Aeromicrobium sp. CTD01-1L150]|uniref:ABC transporter ATP-binding protein n=1 Tax=Aeromicrobium sp. CTD01-1L150 TaxID=3341830 RepID=UPI0035C0D469